MGKVTIEALSEEMIVAEDLYDYKDRLLLKKGTVLSKSSIERLKTWGIKEVYVVDSESDDDPGETEAEVQRITGLVEDLDRKFSDFTDNKLMINLKEVIKEYLQEKLSSFAGSEDPALSGIQDRVSSPDL